MLLLEAKQLKKYYGDRLILEVPDLKVYGHDRIGVVGPNGAGKTTLLDLLCGRLAPDDGSVAVYGSLTYLSQLEPPKEKRLDPEMASRFSVPAVWHDQMSGGEKTRFKLAQIMGRLDCHMILADEPTSSLDIGGIELLEEMLESFAGALMVVSHDRDFLDRLCSKILEVEAGRITIYPGNYSEYARLKAEHQARAEFEYQQYVKENSAWKRWPQGLNSSRPASSAHQNAWAFRRQGCTRWAARMQKPLWTGLSRMWKNALNTLRSSRNRCSLFS